jgi:hypothetical protein
MKALLIGILVAAAGGALSISCGSSSGGSGDSSGLPRSSTVGSLSSADAATLCDWLNAAQGGYGRMVTCSDGNTRKTDTNQATCVAGSNAAQTACPTLTVGEAEDCVNAIGSDLCAISTASACAAVSACLGY